MSGGPDERQIRGGAFDSQAPALTCTFDRFALPLDSFRPTLGFRCCADTEPTPSHLFRNGFEEGSTAAWSATVP